MTSIQLETILKRDRWIVLAGLTVVILLSWIYLLLGAGMGMSGLEMTRLSSGDGMMMDMEETTAWSFGYGLLMFFMGFMVQWNNKQL